MIEFLKPGGRGFTVPMAAILAFGRCRRACTVAASNPLRTPENFGRPSRPDALLDFTNRGGELFIAHVGGSGSRLAVMQVETHGRAARNRPPTLLKRDARTI